MTWWRFAEASFRTPLFTPKLARNRRDIEGERSKYIKKSRGRNKDPPWPTRWRTALAGRWTSAQQGGPESEPKRSGIRGVDQPERGKGSAWAAGMKGICLHVREAAIDTGGKSTGAAAAALTSVPANNPAPHRIARFYENCRPSSSAWTTKDLTPAAKNGRWLTIFKVAARSGQRRIDQRTWRREGRNRKKNAVPNITRASGDT